VDIQARSNQLYDRIANHYESEPGHGISSDAEQQAWKNDLAPVLAGIPGKRVTDVGCGTGVLTRLLAREGFSVEGIDSSPAMVAEARRLLPVELADQVSFSVGDAHSDHFQENLFDAVLSRQVVCHLHDPLQAFRQWLKWLKPGGLVIVIDGFWSRQRWASGDLADDLDALPLSCVQTLGTVAYLLEAVGFDVEQRKWLEAVNQSVAIAEPGAIQRAPRYIVVARK
jgi:ubiquinone/menaquinone biosynthesis C-methylase UbiE